MENQEKKSTSQLIAALREAVAVVQMVLYKELRNYLLEKNPSIAGSHTASLAGAITNEVFGTRNLLEKHKLFRQENWGVIEQELLGLKEIQPTLCNDITDALRIQAICDQQEGNDGSDVLIRAKEYGFLIEDREIPLPSSFMTMVRNLGEKHQLIIAPQPIHSDQETPTIH